MIFKKSFFLKFNIFTFAHSPKYTNFFMEDFPATWLPA